VPVSPLPAPDPLVSPRERDQASDEAKSAAAVPASTPGPSISAKKTGSDPELTRPVLFATPVQPLAPALAAETPVARDALLERTEVAPVKSGSGGHTDRTPENRFQMLDQPVPLRRTFSVLQKSLALGLVALLLLTGGGLFFFKQNASAVKNSAPGTVQNGQGQQAMGTAPGTEGVIVINPSAPVATYTPGPSHPRPTATSAPPPPTPTPVPGPPGPGVNLLANPGFEGYNGWCVWINTSGQHACDSAYGASSLESSPASHSGSDHRVHWATYSYDLTTYQVINAPVSASYYASMWVETGCDTTGTYFFLKNSTTGLGYGTVNIGACSQSWSYIQIGPISFQAGARVEFEVRSINQANQWVRFDDADLWYS
jgi:hypothetical protein